MMNAMIGLCQQHSEIRVVFNGDYKKFRISPCVVEIDTLDIDIEKRCVRCSCIPQRSYKGCGSLITCASGDDCYFVSLSKEKALIV